MPGATIDCLPDDLLGRVLELAEQGWKKPERSWLQLVCRHWMQVYYDQPAIFGSVSFLAQCCRSTAALQQAGAAGRREQQEEQHRQRQRQWLAAGCAQLARVSGVVQQASIEDGQGYCDILEAGGGNPADLLRLLRPDVVTALQLDLTTQPQPYFPNGSQYYRIVPLSRWPPFAPAAEMALHRFPHLTSLHLGCTQLPPNAASALASLPRLRRLHLRAHSMPAHLCDAVAQLLQLSDLGLNVLTGGFEPLSLGLTQLTNLTHLELSQQEPAHRRRQAASPNWVPHLSSLPNLQHLRIAIHGSNFHLAVKPAPAQSSSVVPLAEQQEEDPPLDLGGVVQGPLQATLDALLPPGYTLRSMRLWQPFGCVLAEADLGSCPLLAHLTRLHIVEYREEEDTYLEQLVRHIRAPHL